MRKMLVMLAILLFTTGVLLAQKTITGKVTDEKGDPIANASVVVKGTTSGTTTKDDGTFSIILPSNAKILLITSIGSKEKEVNIGSNASFTISLTSSEGTEEEIVVVAYGTQKRESITGSVAKIGAAQLETRLTTNISQALAGAAPGIGATSGNGQPGSNAGIRIRGFGSINASSSPLYVVDGFPYSGYIGDLNTNDIESISLLKDASSTALYGARAANGVVMITTKRGKSGAPKVNLALNTGFSQRGIAEYDRVGAYDYYPLMWQAMKHGQMHPSTGVGSTEPVAAQYATNNIASQLIYNPFNVPNNQLVGIDGKFNPNATLLYNDFDWYNGIERNGPRNEASINISSKLNKSDYFFSLNYLNDKGFVLKSDFERINARLALNTQIKDWLKSGINFTGILVNSNQAAAGDDNTSSFVNPFVFARGMGPIYPVHAYSTTGEPILDGFGNRYYDYGMHPGAVNRPTGASQGRHILYETMLNNRISKRNSIVARTYLEAKFLNDFTFTTNVGVDLNNARTSSFQNKIVGDGVTAGGTASRSANEYRTFSFNQLLKYDKQFGLHNVNVLLGHETQNTNEETFSGSRRGMNFDGNEELVNFVTLAGVSGQLDRLRREGYFSRLNYGYNGKYYVDLSYRRDASSRFIKQNRWGDFYSVGLSWNAIKEGFLAGATGWLSDLKLRASYGTVGNDALDTYYEYQGLYGLGWNNAAEPGALASKITNPDLTWEVNKTISLGIDFGFLKNRISGSIELFDRGSSELLFDVPQGLTSVVTTRTENIGAMSNRGIEVQLNLDIVKTRDLNWTLQLNATSLKNKITKLPNGNPITSGTKRLEEGKDIYAFYLRRWYGVDPTDGSGLWYAAPGTTTDYRLNGKGDTLTFNQNNAEFHYAGSAIPKLFGAITNTVSFKAFSLSFLLNYQLGGKFYDGNYAGLLATSYGRALHVDNLRAWQKAGDITDIPRLDINHTSRFNSQSDRFLIDASYLNIRNLTLSYDLPKAFINKANIDRIKIYVGGENLAVISKRKGMNPAESFNGTNSAIYVPNRVVNFGVNLTF